MDRRRALQASTLWLAAPAAAGLSGCTPYISTFPTWASAREAVLDLRFSERVVVGNPWNLSQVLQHLTQSIAFSMQGFPVLKPAWFRSTLGSAAFTVFSSRGEMTHALDEPIPGAPALASDETLKTAVQGLLDTMEAFQRFNGPLRPHFAYGDLTKPQYERAHLMHLANHWTQFQAKTANA